MDALSPQDFESNSDTCIYKFTYAYFNGKECGMKTTVSFNLGKKIPVCHKHKPFYEYCLENWAEFFPNDDYPQVSN
jgi:hypothetical protein